MDGTNGRYLGLLVVGAGFQGAQRAAAATIARGVQLVAVTDPDPALAKNVARLHGASVVPDLEAGLALDRVDAVVVASPHAFHDEQVRRSLEAGRHVLCEKPLTIDPARARELAALAQDTRRRLATGFNHRFYPPIRDALAMVDSRVLGRVEVVRARIGHQASPSFLSGWHTDVSWSGGGTLVDNGPHACDLIRRLLGEVSGVEASVADRIGLAEGCESEAYAKFRGRDGGHAEVWSSWTQDEGYLTVEVEGALGRLRVETAPWSLAVDLADGTSWKRSYLANRILERCHQRWFRCERSLVRELELFATEPRELQHNTMLATAWDGCRATEMVHAAYESARTGRVVSLDPLPVRLPGVERHVRRSTRA